MGAHFAQKIVEIESDLGKSMRQSLKDTEFNHLNGSEIGGAGGMDASSRDMGSTVVPMKQSLTGMYLSADAQGVNDPHKSKPLDPV